MSCLKGKKKKKEEECWRRKGEKRFVEEPCSNQKPRLQAQKMEKRKTGKKKKKKKGHEGGKVSSAMGVTKQIDTAQLGDKSLKDKH